jgi:hypothetical protein
MVVLGEKWMIHGGEREREREMGDLMLFWVSWWGRERKVANGGERGEREKEIMRERVSRYKIRMKSYMLSVTRMM